MYYSFQTKLLDLKQINYSIMKFINTLLILLIPFVGFGQTAGVFFGMGRRINLSAKLTF